MVLILAALCVWKMKEIELEWVSSWDNGQEMKKINNYFIYQFFVSVSTGICYFFFLSAFYP